MSLIVALLSHETWGIYAILPLLLNDPLFLSIYPKIEYRSVVFPDPTLPITDTNWPLWILKSLIYKFYTTADELEETTEEDLLD